MNTENKMIYNEIWNAICYTMENNKFENETTLQILLENSILQRLNWEISKGEIIRPTIQYGSAHFIKPDAVLCKDGNNLLVIELKKAFAKLSENNEQQLFSYMRELKLQFGILWGKSLCVYYDDILDKKQPQKVCEIFFDKDNENGIELIKNLVKDNFNEIIFENYCLAYINKITQQKENEQKINFLCSENGTEYIKQLLLTEYSSEIINSVDIKITNNKRETGINNLSTKTRNANDYVTTTNDKDLAKKKDESVQKWLKRIFAYLLQNNKLTNDEIERLHNKNYTQQTFGISSCPLLFDNREDSFIAGQYRSWRDKIGDYYLCSQFTNTPKYENNIAVWLNKMLSK